MEDEPFDSVMSDTMRMRVGAVLFVGQNGFNGALGEGTVADFAAAGAGHTSDFTDAVRREVVVEHEAALLLALVGFEPLGVVAGAEGRGDERLGFAAGEQGGAVGAGQDADLDVDLADLVEGAAIRADAIVEDLVAEDVFADQLEGLAEALGRGASSARAEPS